MSNVKNPPILNQERKLDNGDFIVSKTDLRGIITYANIVFLNISKFTEKELIGSPHNIVRHPDMPKAAFQDLWDTIKQGKEWRGFVKNICKDGYFYWVDAYVTPNYQNGEHIGYTSMRRKPSDIEIKNIEVVYKKMIQEERK